MNVQELKRGDTFVYRLEDDRLCPDGYYEFIVLSVDHKMHLVTAKTNFKLPRWKVAPVYGFSFEQMKNARPVNVD